MQTPVATKRDMSMSALRSEPSSTTVPTANPKIRIRTSTSSMAPSRALTLLQCGMHPVTSPTLNTPDCC